ncbi:MAG: DUF4391 domain-containing protein [Campylobacterota bacterium]|nr:DUF4391 domain-containing protein [Campylobacterota bacterium]
MIDFNLPNTAKVDKFIPKTTFIKKITNGKAIFENIEKITWSYKLSPKTINIPKTSTVEEIHIFNITLKSKEIPTKALNEIKKLIPYPILFCFKYDEQYAYGISLLNEQKYYFTDFDEAVEFSFNDTNLEKVYENIVKKFLKNIDTESTTNIDFKQTIQNDNKISILKKEIQALENKIKKEKQFKKQLELSRQLKPKQKELENLIKGIQ